ncbi:MAG: alpha/beta hydrolase [Ginsengibacter sp.]
MSIITIAFGCLIILLFSSCKKNINAVFGHQTDLSDSKVIRDIVYGSNDDWQGRQQDLKMDIYLPKNESATSKKYPVLVFIHGGGFQKGDKSTTESFAALLNKKGYAVATINYRLGWTNDTIENCNDDTLQAVEAVYRAMQDSRAALRFIAAYADKYQLDENWIFVGGSSAGGVSALNATYYTPSLAEIAYPGLDKKLGPLDAGNDLNNGYSIKAIVNMWGSIDDLNVITKDGAKPTIFFHGMLDNVVPYDIGHLYSCEKMPVEYGSKPIYDRLTDFGVSAVAHIDRTGGHGVYDRIFQTNNIACFLKGVMNREPQKGYFYNFEGDCGEH